MVPEALRASFRADLVSAFDALRGPEGCSFAVGIAHLRTILHEKAPAREPLVETVIGEFDCAEDPPSDPSDSSKAARTRSGRCRMPCATAR
jgi:hypothetical protein